MRTPLYLVCVVAALAAVTGCAKKGPVGKWTGSEMMGVVTVRMDMAFTTDGKFHETLSGGGPVQVTLVRDGTWVAKGDKLTMSQTSAVMNGMPVGKQTQAPKEVTFTVNGDNLTLQDGSGRDVTFTRVKS